MGDAKEPSGVKNEYETAQKLSAHAKFFWAFANSNDFFMRNVKTLKEELVEESSSDKWKLPLSLYVTDVRSAKTHVNEMVVGELLRYKFRQADADIDLDSDKNRGAWDDFFNKAIDNFELKFEPRVVEPGFLEKQK